jgi:alpha-ketoglutarate-dependent taurine dioxygenase
VTTMSDNRYAVAPDEAAAAVAGHLEVTAAGRQLRDSVERLVRDDLDGPAGFFVLATTGLSEDVSSTFVRAMSELVGELLPQDAHGALLREVRDRGVRLGEGDTGRYSDSRQGGNLHTDGPHRPASPPDCFALHCVRQAPVGGELCLVRVDEVVRRLPAWAVASLQGSVHFDRRDSEPGDRTVARPVLTFTEAGPVAAYLREYIEIGHRHAGIAPLSAEQVAAMDALDALLDDPAMQTRLRLEAGELAFINNRTLLHGRTEFQDDPEPQRARLMLRTWIRRPSSATTAGLRR